MNKIIKAELKAPFTEKERLDFIVENNHQLGYLIEEIETTYKEITTSIDDEGNEISKETEKTAVNLQAYINEKTEEELVQEEQDKINHLTMTALDLVTFVKKLGVTDETIMAYLQANPSVQLQLTLCQNVYCGVVRQLCPIKITEELSLTDEQVVEMFKTKNNIE